LAPAVVRPRLAEEGGDRALAMWSAGRDRPTDGRIARLVVGSSLSGTAVVSPPVVPAGSPDPARPWQAPASFVVLPPEGLATDVVPAGGWTALTAVRFAVGPGSASAGIEIELRSSAGDEASIVVPVAAGRLRTGEIVVSTPLALGSAATGGAGLVTARIRPVGPGAAPQIGLTASGDLAIAAEGIVRRALPEIRLGGTSLFPPSPALDLPTQASIDVRSDGRARMRVGPWGPELLLRRAAAGWGWSFPGPSTDPGTWTDSVVKASPAGAPLVVRLDAPWPIARVSASVMVSALVREDPATITLAASTDGASFGALGAFEPLAVVRQQHATATLSVDGASTSAWFALDLDGAAASTGLNAVWFDLELVAPESVGAALASADAAGLDVGQSATAGDPAAPAVTVDIAAEPTTMERLAWAANDAVAAGASAPGPVLLLAGGIALAVLGWLAVRVAGRMIAVGLLVVAIGAIGMGLAAMPRTAVMPRTQSFGDGELDGAVVQGRTIIGELDGATYISPVVSIPTGSVIDVVAPAGRLAGAVVTVRSVATDGKAGPWLDSFAGLRLEGDGLQVRVDLGRVGARIDRIRIDYRPPLGT
ncbi:MAG TPA: hypothetical protein VK871_09440, partial [Candidatus Limnocylindrales bacterium]|nr:hypothetical protein [Candidatus Limnocylindrales bacterium]